MFAGTIEDQAAHLRLLSSDCSTLGLLACLLCSLRSYTQDKFVPMGSIRLQAYIRLGLVNKSELDSMLDKHLPTTVVATAVVFQQPREAAPPMGTTVATAVPVG